MRVIAICVIGRPTPLVNDVSLVVDRLLAPQPLSTPGHGADLAFGHLLAEARRRLAQRGGPGQLQVYSFESIEAFGAATRHALHPLRSAGLSLELFFVDTSSIAGGGAGAVDTMTQALLKDCQSNGLATRLSPHSFNFYRNDTGVRGVAPARPLGRAAARRADTVRILLDHLEHTHAAHPRAWSRAATYGLRCRAPAGTRPALRGRGRRGRAVAC